MSHLIQLLLRIFLLLLAVLVAIALLAKKAIAEERELTGAQQEFFEKDVRPLLVEHCYECHSAGEANGGLLLDSREGWQQGGDSGAAIVAGKPAESLLIEAVRYQNRDLQMPPQNALSTEQVAVLEKWVAMGAPDPRTATLAVTSGPVGMSIEDGREFWSLKPIGQPQPPQASDNSWVQNPIDAFVLDQLEHTSPPLSPAPPADRRTLIRRVTFDLTGLPPTPQEIRDFLADDSPDAWSRLIDRLLDSPQYGVRWGRHWLDVARYADSNGLDENLAFGTAWRYRDYVVDAFNDDKPFDQFVMEQLAGDLLPHANQETKTATGFLMLGAKVLAEPDMEKLVMDTVDEQLDTLGKAFMGMTIGCSRCHDHKFDPIKQTDYYALAAIFKSTRTFAETRTGVIKHWNEHSFATEEEKAKLKEVEAEIAKRKGAASAFKNKAMAVIRDRARSKATEYLMAATQFQPSAPLSEVEAIAKPADLHPRILHHTRLHLAYNSHDPFFAPWQQLKADGGQAAVEQYYRPLIEGYPAALAAAKKVNPKATKIPDAALEAARVAVLDTSGFLAVPPKVDYAFDAATLQKYYQLEEQARRFESAAADETAAMGVGEQATLTSLPIHIRGSHLNLGDPVAREFPEVMRRAEQRTTFPESESGRLQLARWLASPKHPLTARVIVNRIWGWHFGRALVGTTENFGALGDRPTHPELLDWLARDFVESGWSVKHLHRLILSSATYRMASSHPDESPTAQMQHNTANPTQSDPENLLLWKFRLQRLEAEQIRDAILAVSGRLQLHLGGKSVPLRNRQFVFNHTSVDHTKYDSLRRALYLPVIRNNVYTLFEQFDFPDPTMPSGHRNSTVVAPQALLLLNDPLVLDSATAFATIVMQSTPDTVPRIIFAWERALGRTPTAVEISRTATFIDGALADSVTAAGITPDVEISVWSQFCQTLFASSEFIYVR